MSGRGALATVVAAVVAAVAVACSSVTPTLAPTTAPTDAVTTPTIVCLPTPTVAPGNRLPTLTCADAILAAKTRLAAGRDDVVRIEFGFGDYCPPEIRNQTPRPPLLGGCSGSENVVGGYVRFEFASGPPVMMGVIEPGGPGQVSVTTVFTLEPEPTQIPYAITVRNGSDVAIWVEVFTDASANTVGLLPGEAATVPLFLLDPAYGVLFDVYSAHCHDMLASSAFGTPNAWEVTVANGSAPGTLTMRAEPAAESSPLPRPTNGLVCPGG